MKEAARAEAANPTTVTATPPVSAVHTPAPRSRPSPTSQTSQSSTAVNNSTSNSIEFNLTSKKKKKNMSETLPVTGPESSGNVPNLE
ncbi:hypothetical protein TNCV_4008591 [Trichonephila clavipes]|nr:hypothetical protein TNCV_4008591 [Trichonephila clavipes]